MNCRAWTAAEDEYLRAHHGTDVSARQIAVALGRTQRSVYGRSFNLGLTKPRKKLGNSAVVDALCRFHPMGWCDSEIARWLTRENRIPTDHHRIGRMRDKLGLTSNVHSAHQRARAGAKTREQLAAAGFQSFAQVRVAGWNQWKRDLGWPESLTIRAVQSVELFYRRGPMTRMQLCAALGIDKKKRLKRTEPFSNAKGGTVLAELVRAGLLMRLPKQVPSGLDRRGQVRKVDLYMLNPGVSPDVRTRKQSAAS